jgi:hypothetical protein
MSAPLHPVDARRQRALERLGEEGAVLAPHRDGRGHGVYRRGDRRRRATARLNPADVRALVVEGAIVPSGIAQCFLLSGAGRAALARLKAKEAPWRAQHGPLVERPVMTPDGVLRFVVGADPAGPVARLARVSDSAGVGFFAGREIAAARQLWEDFAQGQQGLARGSDWTAPPRGKVPRGPGGTQEHAAVAAIDARRRVTDALAVLPLRLADALRAFLLEEQALDTLERARRWPARSAKLVLKLGLELLADHYGLAAEDSAS